MGLIRPVLLSRALFYVLQYNQLYQNVKQFSKTGEYFCKELMTVFQQRYVQYSCGFQTNF